MCIRFPISKFVPAAALSLVLGLPAVVSADTITVCWDGSGDYLTIQAGIDAASDGDEVVVCDGVYTGPGNKNLDFGGKAITVRSENGPDNCIIDCENDGRGFYFHNDETADALVDGFTITNGNVGTDAGGAVVCAATSPIISNCVIVGNVAASGGGIYCYDGAPTITSCTITGNTATHPQRGGGGVRGFATSPTIADCTITDNVAAGQYAIGGGIFCERPGTLTIDNCTIAGNTAPDGGGVCGYYWTDVRISNSTITGNLADGYAAAGGGVLCWQNATLWMTNCTVSDNVASHELAGGGGVMCLGINSWISNCTISGNVATGEQASGGGLFCTWGGLAQISNCLITANAADAYGGALATAEFIDVRVTNCTISANSAAAGRTLGFGADWSRAQVELGNCILWNGDDEVRNENGSTVTITYSDVQGGWPGWGNIDADPLFVDPDNDDFHLAGGSPCIDAGCNMGVPADFADLDDDGDTDEITPLDLDGEGRFFDDPETGDTGCGCPPIVDMGAYEFGGAGPQPCPGDLDCDRVVGHSDLGILLTAWHSSDEGDLNCDGLTNHADLGVLLGNWGNVCP